MDVQSERLFVLTSAQVSAGDNIVYAYVGPQQPALQLYPINWTGAGSVSNPMLTMLEFMRRCMTHLLTPSATLASGGSAGSVALTFGTAPSGYYGMLQGVPFQLSALGTLSAQPTSLVSTTSNQIRKVLVCLGMSTLPLASSFALGGGTLQFEYGSAMTVSTGAVTSGGQGQSYFDYVPLPFPSANEVPVGWLNIVNSFPVSTGIVNSCMFTDFRVTQGLNFSAMMLGVTQP